MPDPIRLVAGFGCKRGCPATLLAALLDRTLAEHGLERSQVRGIASLDRKADEPGLVALAASLQVPFQTFTALQLGAFEARLTHRSALSFAHTGCHGVAESSALALSQALGTAEPQLRVGRQAREGATLALAVCSA